MGRSGAGCIVTQEAGAIDDPLTQVGLPVAFSRVRVEPRHPVGDGGLGFDDGGADAVELLGGDQQLLSGLFDRRELGRGTGEPFGAVLDVLLGAMKGQRVCPAAQQPTLRAGHLRERLAGRGERGGRQVVFAAGGVVAGPGGVAATVSLGEPVELGAQLVELDAPVVAGAAVMWATASSQAG